MSGHNNGWSPSAWSTGGNFDTGNTGFNLSQMSPSQSMSFWPQGGASTGMPDMEQMGQQAMYDYYKSLPGIEQQKLDILKSQKPGPWATGAQAFGNVAQGLAGLGGMYLGYQQMKGQKKAFEFNKGVMNTNLNNSITDYNRRLGETLTNRALNNGQGQGWVSGELAKYSATRSK